MSVSSSLTLPAQPAIGSSFFVPLGGDGFTSPMSMFEVAITQDSDASGGTNVATVNFDTRFESVVVRAEIAVDSVTAAADYAMVLNQSQSNRIGIRTQGQTDFNALVGINHAAWDLPPIMNAQNIRFEADNVDATETAFFSCLVYNFNIDASRRMPLAILLASLPRASFTTQ